MINCAINRYNQNSKNQINYDKMINDFNKFRLKVMKKLNQEELRIKVKTIKLKIKKNTWDLNY